MESAAVAAQAAAWRGLTPRRVLWIVGLLAIATRAWGLWELPLIVTNDGVGYLTWGLQAHRGEGVYISPMRTPAYPFFLAGLFAVGGEGPWPILVAQRLLGVLSGLLVTAAALRVAAPPLALVAGLMCVFDPWLFAHESYALSETLTVFLTVVAAAITIGLPRPHVMVAAVLGLTLGLACLTRPALQVAAPFLLGGWLWQAYGLRWRAVLPALVGLTACAAMVAPWILHNQQRGIRGLATGSGGVLWMGLARVGLVTPQTPCAAADLRADFAALHARRAGPEGVVEVNQCHAFALHRGGFGERSAEFRDWARAAIAAQPLAYARLVAHAVLWQLNVHGDDEITDFVHRVGQPGPNFWIDGDPERLGLTVFAMSGADGPLQQFCRYFKKRRTPGVPQVPIMLLAAAVVPLGLRRQPRLAAASVGIWLFVLAHAALLMPYSRYALPAYAVAYILAAAVPRLATEWRGQSASSAAK